MGLTPPWPEELMLYELAVVQTVKDLKFTKGIILSHSIRSNCSRFYVDSAIFNI